jgi:hypothetical protein
LPCSKTPSRALESTSSAASTASRTRRFISGGPICWARSERCEEASPAGRPTPAADVDGGGASTGHPSVESHQRKKLGGPKAKRAAAQWSTERFGLSQRRVCRLLALDRNTLWYCSQRQDDAVLRTRIRAIAEQKRRYGCPRIYVRLRREGWQVTHKKVEWIYYRDERLSLRRRRRKKLAAVPRIAYPRRTEPGRCYALDLCMTGW